MALSDNIVSYWKLDESSGNIADATGGGWTGTNVNTVTFSSGKINNGANFASASSQQFTVSSSFTDLNSNTAFSFSYWMKRTDTSNQFIGTRCNGSAHAQWNIYVNNGGAGTPNVAFEISPINNSSNQLACAATFANLQDGNWHHVVITYDGSRSTSGVTIYIDGSSRTVTSITNTLSTNAPTGSSMAIGSRTSTFGSYYDGSLDEFGIWSRALTSGEVTSLYNSGAGVQYPFLNAYLMTASLGTFALTGVAAGLLYKRVMSAAVGSFALTGIAATLRRGFGIVASAGSYVLTGIDAAFRFSGWANQTKSPASFSNQSKNTASFSKQSKNSATWSNQTKN
jgi:hypothetical protein